MASYLFIAFCVLCWVIGFGFIAWVSIKPKRDKLEAEKNCLLNDRYRTNRHSPVQTLYDMDGDMQSCLDKSIYGTGYNHRAEAS